MITKKFNFNCIFNIFSEYRKAPISDPNQRSFQSCSSATPQTRFNPSQFISSLINFITFAIRSFSSNTCTPSTACSEQDIPG